MVRETPDAFVIDAKLPGLRPEDIEISVEDGRLTIRGERSASSEISGESSHRVERRYGGFFRSIALPSGIKDDAIEASYDDGVLTITVPKAEQAKPRRIEVKAR